MYAYNPTSSTVMLLPLLFVKVLATVNCLLVVTVAGATTDVAPYWSWPEPVPLAMAVPTL